MQIGARIHDHFWCNTRDFPEQLKNSGSDCVQLAPNKVFLDFDDIWMSNAEAALPKLRAAISGLDIPISVLSCYINPLDRVNLAGEQEKFLYFTKLCALLGAGMIATETGIIDYDLVNYKQNHSASAFATLINCLAPLLENARRLGVTVGIEPLVYTPIKDTDSLSKLINALGHDKLAVVFDPVNLLSVDNYFLEGEVIDEFLKKHGERIRVIHLKDYVVKDGQIIYKPLFQGQFDTERFLKQLKKYGVDCDIILEETTSDTFMQIKRRLDLMIKGAVTMPEGDLYAHKTG